MPFLRNEFRKILRTHYNELIKFYRDHSQLLSNEELEIRAIDLGLTLLNFLFVKWSLKRPNHLKFLTYPFSKTKQKRNKFQQIYFTILLNWTLFSSFFRFFFCFWISKILKSFIQLQHHIDWTIFEILNTDYKVLIDFY